MAEFSSTHPSAGSVSEHARRSQKSPLIVIAGPPNTGKSTLFNQLTGLRQRVANYSGVTIEILKGRMLCDGQWRDVLDLPGTNSLNSGAPDEQIAVDLLLGRRNERPDLVLNVVEAARPWRGLLVAWQMAAFGVPQIVVFNFADEAAKLGLELDEARLSQGLQCPVVVTTGTRVSSSAALRATIEQTLAERPQMPSLPYPSVVEQQSRLYQETAREKAGVEMPLPLCRRALLDPRSTPAPSAWPVEEQNAFLNKARASIMGAGFHPYAVESRLANERAKSLREQGLLHPELPAHFHRLDRIFLHPVGGPVVFLVTMAMIFQAVYTWAGPAMDGIEGFFGLLAEKVAPLLEGVPLFQALVTDGILAGVGGVLVFLPQIVILYALITLLEDMGYLARAAFLSDKFFGWCGLNGRSFIPLLSSFACAIPGIMSARSIESRRVRHTTALLAPLMSCSARLPVYVLIIGILIEPRYGAAVAGLVLFLCHFLGAGVAIAGAWLVQRFQKNTQPTSLLMEIPPLRRPQWKNVVNRVTARGLDFVKTAGTVILAASIVIWALASFPRPADVVQEARAQAGDSGSTEAAVQQAVFEQSYLSRFGKSIQPVFAPAGFDWKLTVGIVASLPAREVIIATLGTIYGIADSDEENPGLRQAIANDVWESGPRKGEPVLTLATGLSLIIFFALCMQCWATVAILGRELGTGYAVSTFVGYTCLAWLFAVLTYQTLSEFGL